MTREKNALEAIQARGHRITRQRRLILEVLEASQEHLDAETLYGLAKARDPKISLATVYRSLALLKEAGLVEENRLGEVHSHFETIQKSPHYHFTCLGCGRVIELEAPQVMAAVRKLGEQESLEVTGVRLHLSGKCPQCR